MESNSVSALIQASKPALAGELQAQSREELFRQEAVALSVLLDLRSRINALSPLDRLPPEILLHIFEHLACCSYYDDVTPLDYWDRLKTPVRTRQLFVITHVCRRWREVSLNVAGLWKRANDFKPDRIDTFLERSRDAAISLHLQIERIGTLTQSPLLMPTLNNSHIPVCQKLSRTIPQAYSPPLLKTGYSATMRLLNTSTYQLVSVQHTSETHYAILSHVWDPNGEQTFQDVNAIHTAVRSCRQDTLQDTDMRLLDDIRARLSPKIRRCCDYARAHGYVYLWIDTCCIDKTSSAELSEAINSMFAWYSYAGICYVLLSDVEADDNPVEEHSSFRCSMWFKRGWTLQELIVPSRNVFLSKDWRMIGTKASLANVIEDVTGIDPGILLHTRQLHTVSVADRMAWAAGRETTRVEDKAYCLMGVFGVCLPVIYGEGSQAFIRLQEEIMRRIPDQSLFLWGVESNIHCIPPPAEEPWPELTSVPMDNLRASKSAYLFALSPMDFSLSKGFSPIPLGTFSSILGLPEASRPPLYTPSSYGVRTTFPIGTLLCPSMGANSNVIEIHVAILACQDVSGRIPTLLLSTEVSSGQHLTGGFRLHTSFRPSTLAELPRTRGTVIVMVSICSATVSGSRRTLHATVAWVSGRNSQAHDWGTTQEGEPNIESAGPKLVRASCTHDHVESWMNGRQRFEGPPGAPTVALQFIPWDDHTNDPVFSNIPVNGTFLLAPRASEAASTGPERVATGDGVDVLPNAYDTRTPSNLSFAGTGMSWSSATSYANACSDESASMASAEELDQFILTEGPGEEEGFGLLETEREHDRTAPSEWDRIYGPLIHAVVTIPGTRSNVSHLLHRQRPASLTTRYLDRNAEVPLTRTRAK
ncbi:hypothetical protein VTO73DRAFT_7993 [Trametes versicolor]